MLLACDIGNTNTVCGLFDKNKLISTFRMISSIPHTSDEYGLELDALIRLQNVNTSDIDGVIVASVVPKVMHSFVGAIEKYIHCRPIIVGPGTKSGIKICIANPLEVGADRIVDEVAAYELYGGPVMVIDYGTATTYDVVTEDGRYIGGVTAPGLGICAKALWEDTAKLPEVEIKMPKSVVAVDTISSMQAGLMYGQIGASEYIIRKLKEETGYADMKVVATGGLGRLIANETKMIDVYDSNLTLEGLRLIYAKNR